MCVREWNYVVDDTFLAERPEKEENTFEPDQFVTDHRIKWDTRLQFHILESTLHIRNKENGDEEGSITL